MAAEKTLLSQLEVYEVEEIAQLAGVSAATIRKCIADGRLRAQRIGRKWKVTRENALAFLNGPPKGRTEDWKDGRMEEGKQGRADAAESLQKPGSSLPAMQPSNSPVGQPPVHPSNHPSFHPSNHPSFQTSSESEATATQAQLLFLKPEDLDRLVSALAIHVERIERLSERRETELRNLVDRLSVENEALKGEVRELRDEHREAVREAAQRILDELNSAERLETERFRFRWIQDQLTALSQTPPNEASTERRRWWPFAR